MHSNYLASLDFYSFYLDLLEVMEVFIEIGRAMATLMSDEIFHEVAYRARNRDHLLAGIDEFLDAVTVLPPGENNFLTTARIQLKML